MIDFLTEEQYQSYNEKLLKYFMMIINVEKSIRKDYMIRFRRYRIHLNRLLIKFRRNSNCDSHLHFLWRPYFNCENWKTDVHYLWTYDYPCWIKANYDDFLSQIVCRYEIHNEEELKEFIGKIEEVVVMLI